MFATTVIEMYCRDCADLTAFEQPPCLDGHGAECPEWLCVTCGLALLIDVPVQPVERLPDRLRSRAA